MSEMVLFPKDDEFTLKPPVSREDLLRYTESDPEGAEDVVELLREFRDEHVPRPDPE